MLHNSANSSSISYSLVCWLIISEFCCLSMIYYYYIQKNQNFFDVNKLRCSIANFEKLYKKVALKVIERCHGAIKITKHGKIIEVYDTKCHIWSNGLAGVIIKEDCKDVNLRDW